MSDTQRVKGLCSNFFFKFCFNPKKMLKEIHEMLKAVIIFEYHPDTELQ